MVAIKENAFQIIVCKTVGILSRPQNKKSLIMAIKIALRSMNQGTQTISDAIWQIHWTELN